MKLIDREEASFLRNEIEPGRCRTIDDRAAFSLPDEKVGIFDPGIDDVRVLVALATRLGDVRIPIGKKLVDLVPPRR